MKGKKRRKKFDITWVSVDSLEAVRDHEIACLLLGAADSEDKEAVHEAYTRLCTRRAALYARIAELEAALDIERRRGLRF